jgi:CDP-glucose 4,6-dehydratase
MKLHGKSGKMIKKKFWQNKKVLVTGHTGFKGAWICLVLCTLGAKVYGYSLRPEKHQILYNIFKLKKILVKSIFGNIENKKKLFFFLKKTKPEIIIHCAAQSLVLNSYKNPVKTFTTNIIGTINILEFAKNNKVKSCVIVTSDKCYENIKKKIFNENDPLGGKDPYSASKACCEIISNAYKFSFFNKNTIATVRAGNVIGGGDFSPNRIVADFFLSHFQNKEIYLRYPKSSRPWQYILDVINGYLIVAKKLYNNEKEISSAWNFGPEMKNNITVKQLITKIKKISNSSIKIRIKKNNLHEENQILLSNKKSKKILGWKPKMNLDDFLKQTKDWYIAFKDKENMFEHSIKLINKFKF